MSISVQRVAQSPYGKVAQKQKVTNKSGITSSYMNSINSLGMLDKNHSRLLVSFRGEEPNSKPTTGTNLPAVRKPFAINDLSPLEKKVGMLVSEYKNGEHIVIASDIEKAKNALKKSNDAIDGLVNTVYFIKEKSARGVVSIHRNPNTQKNILTNLGEESVFVKSGQLPIVLYPQKKTELYENDRVSMGVSHFRLNSYVTSGDAGELAMGVDVFDFKTPTAVKKLNYKNFESLTSSTTGEKKDRKITFASVGGQDAAIEELRESIIFPIEYPEAFDKTVNKGIILTGGPGTGKTLLAEAVANEVDAHFMKLNGLEMEESLVGKSEENWRNLFEEAKANQPTVLFIDEFDAVARKREEHSTARYDNKVVNQILTLMSDLEKSQDQVFVVVATNKLDMIDDAVTRDGRFGKHIHVDNPDLDGCKKILDIHLKGEPVSPDLDREGFAQKLYDMGANGSSIEAIAKDSRKQAYKRLGILSKMKDKTFVQSDIENLKITSEDFENAIDAKKKQNELDAKKAKENNNYVYKPVLGFVDSKDN